MGNLNKADNLVIQFVRDAKNVLEDYDKKIYKNLKSSKYKDFYEEEWKGIGISGINETIIRFLISLELSRKYAIESEKQYYRGSKKHADLTIWTDHSKDEPDITIEIKWSAILENIKPNNFSQWSIDRIQEDLRKLRDYCETPNKYVLQIAFVPKSITLSKSTLQKQMNSVLTKHITRTNDVKIMLVEGFKTCSENPANDLFFGLICWKLIRKGDGRP